MNHRVLGAVFLALLLTGVYLTYGVFTKKFTSYDEVTLKAGKIGLQLPARADVKVRGVLVGEVLDYEPHEGGVDITLGLYQDQREQVPANVTGLILPKTLFGEKYVSLIIPDGGPSGEIKPGATIAKGAVSIEVEQVLADLYPLLRAVRPADLNATLNALATALEGRGDDIGENLETLDGYLKRLNPQIPDIVEDLKLTTDVAHLYSDVLPEVAGILRDTIVTTGTLKGRAKKLNTLFQDVSAFSATTERFLDANGDNIVRVGELGAAQLRVLAKYAPEYPCLTKGIVAAGKLQAATFRDFTLHIVLETIPNQPRAYGPADRPRYGEKSGPKCLHLPNPPFTQSNPATQPNFADGVDSPTGKGTMRTTPGFARTPDPAGTQDETALLKGLLGPALGSAPDAVDDLAVLMVAPMARGAEVSYR
ncbi:MAG: MCE family protein [Nocardioides sp.]|jgi:phospholipid/cholesterol/gamma-HCH transport system substrate-binding protein